MNQTLLVSSSKTLCYIRIKADQIQYDVGTVSLVRPYNT